MEFQCHGRTGASGPERLSGSSTDRHATNTVMVLLAITLPIGCQFSVVSILRRLSARDMVLIA
jgi:hypothetical protein